MGSRSKDPRQQAAVMQGQQQPNQSQLGSVGRAIGGTMQPQSSSQIAAQRQLASAQGQAPQQVAQPAQQIAQPAQQLQVLPGV